MRAKRFSAARNLWKIALGCRCNTSAIRTARGTRRCAIWFARLVISPLAPCVLALISVPLRLTSCAASSRSRPQSCCGKCGIGWHGEWEEGGKENSKNQPRKLSGQAPEKSQIPSSKQALSHSITRFAWASARKGLSDVDRVKQVCEHPFALGTPEAGLGGVGPKAFGTQQVLDPPDQSCSGLALDEERGLDEIMDPAPAGKAGHLPAFPVQPPPISAG